MLSGTVSLSENSIGSYLLPIAKVPYVSPAFPSHKRTKLIILCTNLTVRLNSNTQLEHCDNSLIDVEDDNDNAPSPQAIPQITQDEYDSPPAANTRQQQETRTLTQDFMLQCMEIPGYKAPFSPQQAASRKYPLQFLCDLAYAVLDDETGDLLEYRHLMKHPKYRDVWTKSFGTEI